MTASLCRALLSRRYEVGFSLKSEFLLIATAIENVRLAGLGSSYFFAGYVSGFRRFCGFLLFILSCGRSCQYIFHRSRLSGGDAGIHRSICGLKSFPYSSYGIWIGNVVGKAVVDTFRREPRNGGK